MSESQQYPGLSAVLAGSLTAEEAGRSIADGLATLGRIAPGQRISDIDTRTLTEILESDQAAGNDDTQED